jgi:GntR family transcriptional regulator
MSLQSAVAQLPAFAGPLYMQVASVLRAKIYAAEWTSRAPLPNEVSLARDIGVSIGTVRKALEMLENEHLIQRRQGRGTFVVESSDETELERFSNHTAGSTKLRAATPVWSLTLGEATGEGSQMLNLRPSVPVYRLETVWAAGDALVAFETINVEVARFPDLQAHLSEGGQYLFPVYRRHYQEVVSRVSESLTAVNADDAVAARLQIANGKAVMRVDRVAYAMSGGPIEWSRRYMYMTRAAYAVAMT